MPKGETYVVFKARTAKRLNTLFCAIGKHRKQIVDHGERIDVAEERLDRHEADLIRHRRDIDALATATKALKEIEARRAVAERAVPTKGRRR